MAFQPVSNTSAGKFLEFDGRLYSSLYSQVKTVSVQPRLNHAPSIPFLS